MNPALDRRRFLAVMAQASGLLGAEIVFSKFMPRGLLPVALAEQGYVLDGKHPELVLLNDRPVNAETPPHLLDDDITPADRFFVRNNGLPPENVDVENWRLSIDGEAVQQPREYSLAELMSRFQQVSYQLVLECGGNGRAEFSPPARGNQWSTGAVGCAEWSGVRLADVLDDVGLKHDAVYIGYYGADLHLSRDPHKIVISRGMPMRKALDPHTLLAWKMNGEDLPLLHGYPLRLVAGGWPASVSGKWLNRISVRDKVHDGPKMGGYSYRVPCEPVAPGADVAEEDMCIIESMPVKSLISWPRSGLVHRLDKKLPVRGHAWAGDDTVKDLQISINFGQTWEPAALRKPANPLAWQRFNAEVRFPKAGYYEVWARATDSRGQSQPMVLPGWNPRGYLNNACHRIAVKVV